MCYCRPGDCAVGLIEVIEDDDLVGEAIMQSKTAGNTRVPFEVLTDLLPDDGKLPDNVK